jgi:hypothetical protein
MPSRSAALDAASFATTLRAEATPNSDRKDSN